MQELETLEKGVLDAIKASKEQGDVGAELGLSGAFEALEKYRGVQNPTASNLVRDCERAMAGEKEEGEQPCDLPPSVLAMGWKQQRKQNTGSSTPLQWLATAAVLQASLST